MGSMGKLVVEEFTKKVFKSQNKYEFYIEICFNEVWI